MYLVTSERSFRQRQTHLISVSLFGANKSERNEDLVHVDFPRRKAACNGLESAKRKSRSFCSIDRLFAHPREPTSGFWGFRIQERERETQQQQIKIGSIVWNIFFLYTRFGKYDATMSRLGSFGRLSPRPSFFATFFATFLSFAVGSPQPSASMCDFLGQRPTVCGFQARNSAFCTCSYAPCYDCVLAVTFHVSLDACAAMNWSFFSFCLF